MGSKWEHNEMFDKKLIRLSAKDLTSVIHKQPPKYHTELFFRE